MFEATIARPLGMSLEHAAYGAHQIVASNMIRAIKAVSTERGRDPREYVLLAFGGNGPVFAAAMADALGMKRILIPPSPGLFSSFGLLYADIEHHYSRTYRCVLGDTDPAMLTGLWNELSKSAIAQLETDGFAPERMRLSRSANLHYQGQTFELTVPVRDGPLDRATLDELQEAFGHEHERTYGHRAGPDEPVELVNLVVVGMGVPERPRLPERLQAAKESGAPQVSGRPISVAAPVGLRPPYSGVATSPRRAWGRASSKSTTRPALCPPGARASLDDKGNIAIEMP